MTRFWGILRKGLCIVFRICSVELHNWTLKAYAYNRESRYYVMGGCSVVGRLHRHIHVQRREPILAIATHWLHGSTSATHWSSWNGKWHPVRVSLYYRCHVASLQVSSLFELLRFLRIMLGIQRFRTHLVELKHSQIPRPFYELFLDGFVTLQQPQGFH